MADELFNALEEKRKSKGYMTAQELINDSLRKSLFAPEQPEGQKPKKKSKAGRPPKPEYDPLIKCFTK